jgi:hypothetical protein
MHFATVYKCRHVPDILLPTYSFPGSLPTGPCCRCLQAFAAVQSSVVHLQGVPVSQRFALVPLGPPLLTYSPTAKVWTMVEIHGPLAHPFGIMKQQAALGGHRSWQGHGERTPILTTVQQTLSGAEQELFCRAFKHRNGIRCKVLAGNTVGRSGAFLTP